MTNSVKMSVFNNNKNCLIDSSVFVLKFSLFNKLSNLARNSFFKKCISSIFFKFIKVPFTKAVKDFVKELYLIFFVNILNFRK